MGNGNTFVIRKYLGMRLSWIDEQLKARKMNRRELADAIGLTEVQMSKVMNGTRRLCIDEGDAIRRAFGYHLPDDLDRGVQGQIDDCLARIDDGQKLTVVLYLEALLGDRPVPARAS